MADKPHQFHMAYVAEQDRLLLRISTTGKAEFRLWLTRRAIRLLWEAILKMIETGSGDDSADEIDKREAILLFEHQSAIEQADFETPFQEAVDNYPLGKKGVLVSSMWVGSRAQGAYTLKLGPRQGNGIVFSLDDSLMHSFMQMLIDSSDTTEWGLDLRLPVSASTTHANLPQRDKIMQ